MKQATRGMVEKIDFYTSFGHGEGGDHRERLGITTKGPTLLITDLAIWKPDPETQGIHRRLAASRRDPREGAGNLRLEGAILRAPRGNASADRTRTHYPARASGQDGTAEFDGAVYVSTVDGLATNDAWQSPTAGSLAASAAGTRRWRGPPEAMRRSDCVRSVRRLLHGRGRGGSDLLAMLTNVRRLLCTLPDAERRVVIISDGGVVAGGVNLYRRPPRTEHARRHLIEHLQRSGEIPPDLDCRVGSPVRVWLSGLGIGIGRRDVAMAVRRFFIEAVESTGAVVAAEGPQLLERGFRSTEATTRGRQAIESGLAVQALRLGDRLHGGRHRGPQRDCRTRRLRGVAGGHRRPAHHRPRGVVADALVTRRVRRSGRGVVHSTMYKRHEPAHSSD